MKLNKEEFKQKIDEKIVDEDLKIELLEDIEDSFTVETEETETIEKSKYEELKTSYEDLKTKYKERFLKGSSDKKEEKEEKDEDLEEKEIVDIKEI